MSGRGNPGGLLVQRHKPGDVKVTLKLRTTTSADVFVLDPSAPSAGNDSSEAQSAPRAEPPPPFYIQIHASVKYSTHPSLPVTLATRLTPLEHPIPHRLGPNAEGGEGEAPAPSPVWLESALTPLRSTVDPDKIATPAGLSLIACRRGGYPRDLRESWDFLTVPAADTHEEVVVRHLLTREGLRFYYKNRDDGQRETKPEKSEKFLVGPSARSLGTFWWRWGDLEGDLKGKHFYSDEWWDGKGGDEDGDRALTTDSDWVASEGEMGFGLTMEVENEVEIEFA